MVDLACRELPYNILFDVICETTHCLPDAVQLLTPCSVGNQWLKIIDVGRFAITCYEKYSGEGIRVYLDCEKLQPWPEIQKWFLKLVPKKQQDAQLLMSQIKEAGNSILCAHEIRVGLELIETRKKKVVSICPVCHEAFRSIGELVCPACKSPLGVSRASFYSTICPD